MDEIDKQIEVSIIAFYDSEKKILLEKRAKPKSHQEVIKQRANTYKERMKGQPNNEVSQKLDKV